MSDASSPPPVRLERIPAYRFHPALPLQACKNLNMNQAERRAADADTAGKIDAFIQVRLCGHCVPVLDCSQWFWGRRSLALPFTQLTVPHLPDRSWRSMRRGSTPSLLRLRTLRATRSSAAQTAAPPVSVHMLVDRWRCRCHPALARLRSDVDAFLPCVLLQGLGQQTCSGRCGLFPALPPLGNPAPRSHATFPHRRGQRRPSAHGGAL